jgi:phosphoadenosine phosphosulfate reductase
MLIENKLWGVEDRVQIAIDRLQQYEPEEGYYLAFSGGKDSVVIKALADMAGVKYDAHYNITGLDPHELVRFIKKNHPDVIREKPKKNMWKMIVEQGMLPLRTIRYCCRELKENGGAERTVITGIRWAESPRRKKQRKIRELPRCGKGGNRYFVNPIIDWSTPEIWEFIKKYGIPYCILYDQGWERLGCILCPMSKLSEKLKYIEQYPVKVRAYKKAINLMMIKNINNKKDMRYKTVDEWFRMWIYEPSKKDERQESWLPESYHYE